MMTPQRLGKTFLLTVGFGCAAAFAGTFNFDFNSDPATILDFCGTAWDGSATSNTGSASWVTSGGAGPVGNTAAGPVAGVPDDGFLRLTFASPDCSGALSSSLCGGVLFNDFDVGMVVAGFTFECDLRLGNGSARPADGFSLSYVRAGDPVLQALAAGDTLPNMNHWISANGGQFADNGSAGDLSLIEEGTQTGLSIGFDLWASGGYTIPPAPPAVGRVAPGLTQDDIGLDLRVDGTLLATIPMPNLEPVSGDDPTSLATGPYDGSGCDTNLTWVHFKADLDTAGVLNVGYKNTRLLTNFATRYYPSPGRLLLAARVGAATANIAVDNIQITTLPASEVAIGPVTGTASGFSLSVADSGPAVADPATVQAWLNGTAITPAVSKTGSTTTISYDDPEHPFPPGATNTVTVSLQQTNGQSVGPVDRTYVVPELGEPPTIAADPADATAIVGTSVSFAVTASGTAPLAYSWRKDDAVLVEGGRITGVNTARLSLTDILASDAGRYLVVVTNPFGSVTTRNAVLTVSGSIPGQKLWEFQAAGPVRSSPAIGLDGTVYVAADYPARSVYALNAATGQMLWEFQTSCCNDVRASPAVGSDGTVYVGSDDSRFFALDGATGTQRWEYQTGSGSIFSSPAVGSDGTVYVGSSDKKIHALNGTTGQKRWEFQTGGEVWSSPAIGTGGTVYVGQGYGGKKVYALDGTTGEERWEFQTGGEVWSSPAIGADGTVYVGSFDSKLYALNGATGQMLWEFQTNDAVLSSPAIGADGTVYVGSLGHRLYALNGATGQKLWEFQTDGSVWSSPAIGSDGTVYVGSSGNTLYALNGATGQKLWEYRTGAIEWSSAAIGLDGTVYVGSLEGRLYALSSSSVGGLAASPWPKFRQNSQNTGRVGAGELGKPPTVVAEPEDETAVVGTSVSFAVTANGTRPLAYSWHKDDAVLVEGGRITGVNTARLSITDVLVSDAGLYSAVVTNPFGSVTSRAAGLTITDRGPGQKLWEFQTGGKVWSSPALGTDGTLYVQSNDGRVYALDGGTGQKRWDFPMGGGSGFSSPAIGIDGTVYVGSSGPGNKLYALTGATGQLRWEFPTGGEVFSSPAIGTDGTVYVGSYDNKVYALNGATGNKRWEFPTGGQVYHSPAVGADGTVYVGSTDRKAYALDGATGQKRWEFQADDGVNSSLAIGGDGMVYLTAGRKVHALNGATGQKLWERAGADLEPFILSSSPAIGTDGTVYLGAGGKVHALNGATGQQLWEFPTGGLVLCSPAIGADGTVYVGSEDGNVYALNGTTGEKRWGRYLGDQMWSSPAVGTDGTVYVGSDDGKVYAIASNSLGGLAQSPWPKFRQNAQNTGRVEPAPVPPQITKEPTGLRVPVGGDFQLPVWASGTPPLAYQWFHDGEPVRGAVSSVFRVTNATVSHSGDYQVIVSNPTGAVTSQVARVVVGYVLTLTTHGAGTFQAEPALEVYEPGQTVVLTAIPDGGRTFVGWEGDASGASNPLTLTMNGSGHVQAVFSTLPGDLKWVVATGGPVDSSPAVGADGTVYVGSLDRNVYALDGSTGDRKWAFPTGGWVTSSPAIGADGTVYFGSHDHNVYALDGATGARKWAFLTGGAIYWASPGIGADGMIYVGSEDHRLYALEGATGRQRWAFVSAAEVYSSPALGADGTVYFGSHLQVYAVDGATGAEKWTFVTGGAGSSSPALGADGTVYVGSPDGAVYALDGATGARKWSFGTLSAVYSSPAVGQDGVVYVGSYDGKMYALDRATGAQKWAFVTGDSIHSSPALAADGAVYVGSTDGKVYALDDATGAQRWAFATGHQVTSSPAIGADGTVYVGSNDGKVYALQGSARLADSPWPKFRQNARNTGQGVVVPVVLRQPSRVVLHEGATGKILVKVAGEPVPAFQWHFNGEPIPGATEVTLTLLAITRAAEGTYTLVASNQAGQVTSRPILALVSNVDPQSFLGLKWEGADAGPVSLEATTQLDALTAWQPWFDYPSSGMAQLYVELDLADTARFYRLNSADARRFTAAGWLKGWWMVEPVGTRIRVETVSAASGWTHWQVLTDVILPASPYLFLDLENVGPIERVYRTTVVP